MSNPVGRPRGVRDTKPRKQMSKHPRLSKSGIEYLTHSWGIYSGCQHGIEVCPVSPHCWARSIANRFKAHYPNGFEPTWYEEAFLSPLSIKRPAIIGVGWVGDTFGDWNDPNELSGIFEPASREYELTNREMLLWVMERCPEHRFVFLTKAPHNIPKWGKFPDNASVGVSVCNQKMFDKALIYLSDIETKHKWLSIEPLLGKVVIEPIDLEGISWVAIGAQSNPVFYPGRLDWVENIMWACLDAHIPCWLKNNLAKALPPAPPFYVPPQALPAKGKFEMVYRQEFPKAGK